MGKMGHPVGLYYTAEKSVQAGDDDRARQLLLRAAAAGLIHAYDRLAALETANDNTALAQHYKACAVRQKLHSQPAHKMTNRVRKPRH